MAKGRKRKKKPSTYWQDLGNEVFDGMANVGKGAWREVTFQEDSYNQRAMDKVADVMTGTAAVGSYAAAGAGAVASGAGAAVQTVEDGISSYHDRVWGGRSEPIGRDDDDVQHDDDVQQNGKE